MTTKPRGSSGGGERTLPVDVDEFADRAVESGAELLIGDARDRPSHAGRLAVAPLVVLGVDPSAVPRDVVDLDAETTTRIGSVGMDLRAIGQRELELRNQQHPAVGERA